MDITQWCGRYTKGIKYRVQWENREVYLMYPVSWMWRSGKASYKVTSPVLEYEQKILKQSDLVKVGKESIWEKRLPWSKLL